MTRPVHQLLVGAAPGDAITEMARRIRTGLRRLAPSEIYAFGIDPGTDPAVRHVTEMPPPDPRALLVYHASYGVPALTELLLKRRQPIVLVHHNVTPAKYFIDHNPLFASGLEWARIELAHLRDRVVLAVADSPYNRTDLESLGYVGVRVIAAGLDPHRLVGQPSDGRFARSLVDRCPMGYVLCVSQLLPHKRHDTVIAAMHLVQHVHGLELGLVFIGPSRMPSLTAALQTHADRLRLRNFWLAGRSTDRELATAYRGARLLVSASEHEGIGISPLEAMAFGVPVVARGAGAMPDTVGDSGLVLPETAGPALFAEAIVRATDDARLRSTLVRKGYRHAARVAAADSVEPFVQMISELG